jgi:ubiquitin carboxyl-terminal hydrolase 4/11/15
MNSALQCIVHCQPLTEHFRNEVYKADLNRTNSAGLGGRLAECYAHLISGLFDETAPWESIKPSGLKRMLSELNPHFSGSQQKDSLEFLACLTSGLHEDLNRIQQKPYFERDLCFAHNPGPTQEQLEGWGKEAWQAHKLRNDSIIVDLFHGMFKSITKCGQCDGVAATFDPFADVTVPLPLQKMYNPNPFTFPLQC